MAETVWLGMIEQTSHGTEKRLASAGFVESRWVRRLPSGGYPSALVTAHHSPVAAMAAEQGRIT